MMVQVLTILLVITSSILCSGTQQGVSSTQAGQTLQIQPNVRKYNNKHTVTEKPCTTGSTTGTRKEKPENYSDSQDYVPIGGPAGSGYPYPYPAPYPYQPAYPYPPGGVVLVPGGSNPYRAPYQFEPQYPVEAVPPPYYPPYYAAAAPPPPPPPPPPYVAVPYQPAAYPSAPTQQPLYEQSTVVDTYRSPLQSAYLQQSAEQSQYFRQPAAASFPYYYNNAPQPSPYFRAHAYNRPPLTGTAPAFLQQRDASSSATATGISSSTAANIVEPQQQLQYDQQQSSGLSFDGNQFHF